MNELINRVLPAIIRFGSRPGAILLAAAAVSDGFFLLVSWLAVRNVGGLLAWLLLLVAVVFAVAIAGFAWRRHRLARHLDEMELALGRQNLTSGEIAPATPAPERTQLAEELNLWQEVQLENSLRTARYLPRVEAAQRAMVRAAGGVVNAPYLKDDLRLTLLALLGTIAAIPVSFGGTLLAMLVLALH